MPRPLDEIVKDRDYHLNRANETHIQAGILEQKAELAPDPITKEQQLQEASRLHQQGAMQEETGRGFQKEYMEASKDLERQSEYAQKLAELRELEQRQLQDRDRGIDGPGYSGPSY